MVPTKDLKGLNWERAAMQMKFDLGRVIIQQEAVLALEVSGQEADFFLCKHGRGDCGEDNPSLNDFQRLVKSRYRTLKGQILDIVTFVQKQETYVVALPNVALPTTRTGEGQVDSYEGGCAVCPTSTDTITPADPFDVATEPNSSDNIGVIYDAADPIGPIYDSYPTLLDSPFDADLPESD
jgi:hypothetical protein